MNKCVDCWVFGKRIVEAEYMYKGNSLCLDCVYNRTYTEKEHNYMTVVYDWWVKNVRDRA